MTEIIMHSETQLLDWGETRAGGPWIKLRLPDPDLLEQFRGMDTATLKKTGHILHCTLADGDIVAAEDEPEQTHGQFWNDLFKAGFFRNVEVCRAIGSEAAFEEWIRQQPAVIGHNDYDDNGDIRNQPAHVRRVSEGAGTGTKPPYFCVPMSAEIHRAQHERGYEGLHVFAGEMPQFERGKGLQWFSDKADRYRYEWASKTLAAKLKPGCTSRSEVSPSEVWVWAESNGLGRFVPGRYRQ